MANKYHAILNFMSHASTICCQIRIAILLLKQSRSLTQSRNTKNGVKRLGRGELIITRNCGMPKFSFIRIMIFLGQNSVQQFVHETTKLKMEDFSMAS